MKSINLSLTLLYYVAPVHSVYQFSFRHQFKPSVRGKKKALVIWIARGTIATMAVE